MALRLLDILKNAVICESVSPTDITNAIENRQRVIINYVDDEAHAPKKRVIEPYVYGIGHSGNELLRVYQSIGDTWRGNPKYKTLRIDRIKSWQPTEDHFYDAPRDPYYNENGDKLMKTVYCQAHFNDEDESLFDPDRRLSLARKKTKALQKGRPINISQLKDDDVQQSGPILNKTTEKDLYEPTLQQYREDPNLQDRIKRNLEITRKEKAKRGFSLSGDSNNDTEQETSDGNQRGPITEPIVEPQSVEPQAQQSQEESDFQKMLRRNLEITRQEKAKRGFSLDKIKGVK